MSAFEGFRIHASDALECRVEPFDWRFAHDEAARIDAHWDALRAERPSLFNGLVLLSQGWRFEDGVLRTLHFETGFKNFIAWRDFGFPDPNVRNSFAMAALRGADGAWLVGEMAGHTSTAGQIYFPAGTPDPNDVCGGAVDLGASALRELEEETGLTVEDVDVSAGWSVIEAGPRLGCMKVMQARVGADELAARINEWLDTQDQPELARMHVVRERAGIDPARMPAFMCAWLEAQFTRQPG